MSLPTSGPISFSQLRTEWNISGPVKFSDFYRGGRYVKDNLAVQNSLAVTIPTSGAISLSTFYGKFRYYTYTFTIESGTYRELGTNICILNNIGNYSADSDARGPLPQDRPIFAQVTISSSAVLYGTSGADSGAAYTAFDGSSLEDSRCITYLINNGFIYGGGGNGGRGAAQDSNGSPGFRGGAAIAYRRTLFIVNNGVIYGGGGGGGGGAYSYEGADGGSDTRSAGGGGGGGQGYIGGIGGAGGPQPGPSGFGGRTAAGGRGANGSFSGPGAGGPGGGPSNWGPCAGGFGGGWGQAGINGVAVTAGSQDTFPGIGGAAGECVRKIPTIFSTYLFFVVRGTTAGPVQY